MFRLRLPRAWRKQSSASALLLLAIAISPLPSHAGTIFLNESDFNAAVAGASIFLQEDFEGFPIGPILPTPSQAFLGGSDEVFLFNGGANINVITPESTRAFFGFGDSTILAGPDVPGSNFLVGVGAVSLFHSGGGAWDFFSENEEGQQVAASGPVTPQSSPPIADQFIGWVPDPGERLRQVRFMNAVAVDNITLFALPVPEPTTFGLLLTGLLGLGVATSRKG